MRQLIDAELIRLQSIKNQKGLEKLRVAIYARKSREDIHQSSLETQIETCKSFMQFYPDYFDVSLSEVYSEDNVSGMYIDNREQLHLMMERVKSGMIDVVLCTKVDRLSRSGLNAEKLIQEMNESKAYFIGGDDLGDNSASGVLLKQIQWSINEFHVRRSVEDMIAGKIKKTKDGYACGGPGNFGYDVVNKRYVINPQEAIAVSIIYDRFLAGKSYSQIIDELEVLGFTTRTGKKFSKSTINSILTNERNAGINLWNATRKRKKRKRISKLEFPEVMNDTAIAESIVSKEIFELTKARLEGKAFHREGAIRHSPYLLSGLVVCSHCGRRMTGNNTKGGKAKQLRRVYECANHKIKGVNRCPNTQINADFLEHYVQGTITDLLNQRSTLPMNPSLQSDRVVNDKKTLATLTKQIQSELLMIDKLTNGLLQQTSSYVRESIMKKVKQSESFIVKAKSRKNEIEERIKRYQMIPHNFSISPNLIDKDLIVGIIKSIQISVSEIFIEM